MSLCKYDTQKPQSVNTAAVLVKDNLALVRSLRWIPWENRLYEKGVCLEEVCGSMLSRGEGEGSHGIRQRDKLSWEAAATGASVILPG